MKHTIILLLLIINCLAATGQDMIVTINGDNIPCKVVRVSKKTVKYKLPEIGDTTVHATAKETVSVIKYADGEKEFYNESKVDDNDDEGKWDKDMMAKEGRKDARQNYQEYKGPKTVTTVVAAVAGPVIGLVPAFVYTSNPPDEEDLGYPDEELAKNSKYSASYKNEAKHIQGKKVWNGYLVGALINVSVIVLTVILLAL
jgi:hypothetical protein